MFKKISTLFFVLLSGGLMMTNEALSNDAVKTIKEFYKYADARPVDQKKLRSFFDDKFIDHDPSHGESSIEGVVSTYGMLGEGSPDSKHILEMVLPSGTDKAIVYWRYVGTNTNNLFGMPTMNPARKFDIAGIEIFTVKNGKITDMWHTEEIHKLVDTLTKK